MRFALLLFLTSCATAPVTSDHWTECEIGCGLLGVKEACITLIKGPACKCYDDFTFWVDDKAEDDIEYQIDITE